MYVGLNHDFYHVLLSLVRSDEASKMCISIISLILFIMKTNYRQQTYLIGGITLLFIGVLWLLRSLGITLPDHVISFPTLVIAIGLVILIKSEFKSESGWLIFAFGDVLLLNKLVPDKNLLQIGSASIILVLGAYYLLRYFTDENKSTNN